MRQFFISFMAALAGCWISLFLAFLGAMCFFAFAASSIGSASATSGAKVTRNSVLQVDLGAVSERETSANQFAMLIGDDSDVTTPLNTLLAAIRHAADNKNIDGMVINCTGISAGMAQSEAIVRALSEFKQSEKWIYAYGDNIDQGNYLLASVADSIFLNPVGMVDIHGLSSTTMFYTGLLDKLGVKMQVVKVGTFKSAVEPYILTSMSEANRLQVTTFLTRMWGFIRDGIAERRSITPAQLDNVADSASYAQSAAFYLDNHIIDRTCYQREFDRMIADLTHRKHDEAPRYVSVSDYIDACGVTAFPSKGEKTIAVLYAVGEITDNGTDGIVGATMVPEINALAENDNIDALILRVNSPGGSAFASEQIWEALDHFKKKTGKPFFVSMSDYAASGGYYISCGADRIFAEDLTLTGSIGIFGMIPDASGLVTGKLGITTATVATNPSGAFPTILEPMTPFQRNAIQSNVNRGYELFTSRVAQGRDMPIDSVKAIAEGRVWDGATALEIGLVDQIGGMEATLDAMLAELGVEKARILEFPEVKFDFWKELRSSVPSLRAAAVKAELGEAYPLYMAVKRLSEMPTLVSRTDVKVEL